MSKPLHKDKRKRRDGGSTQQKQAVAAAPIETHALVTACAG